MKPISKIWYWLVVMLVLILAAAITTLFPQTNEVPVSEETKPLDAPNKVEPQETVPTSNPPDVTLILPTRLHFSSSSMI